MWKAQNLPGNRILFFPNCQPDQGVADFYPKPSDKTLKQAQWHKQQARNGKRMDKLEVRMKEAKKGAKSKNV